MNGRVNIFFPLLVVRDSVLGRPCFYELHVVCVIHFVK